LSPGALHLFELGSGIVHTRVSCVMVLCLWLLLIPPALSSVVYWAGPGGDYWNTNSSPFAVNRQQPFEILWTRSSGSDGWFSPPSGLLLLDVGASRTPYIFGSTGWGGNRPYRRNRFDGGSTSWLAEHGLNDSGTGFRICSSPDGSMIYHIDVGDVIRAYPTDANPNEEPTWEVDAKKWSPGLRNVIKTGPDAERVNMDETLLF